MKCNNSSILSGTVLYQDIVNHIISLTCQTSATIQHDLFMTMKLEFIYMFDDTDNPMGIKFNGVVIDPNQVLPAYHYISKPGEAIDLDRIASLTRFMKHDYRPIIVMKLLSRKLLRLSQCSKQLHQLVIQNPVWKHLQNNFEENASFNKIDYPFDFEIGNKEEPISYLKMMYRGGSESWSELQRILNYGKPDILAVANTLQSLKRKTLRRILVRPRP